MTQSIKHKKGFSPVELSVVLTILGIVAYGTISAGMIQFEMARVNQTNNKLDRIDKALTLYLKTYGYLPCPADGTLATTNANFGVDTATHTLANSDSAHSTTCSSANLKSDGTTSPDVYIGVVPTETLGLPDQFMLDGWGNRITYVVSAPCVAPYNWQTASSTYVNQYKCSLDGLRTGTTVSPNVTSGAKISLGYSSSLIWQNTDPKIAYVTISHGANGFGAYGKNAIKKVGTTAGDEEEYNANLNAAGAALGASAGNTSYREAILNNGVFGTANTFDDILRWRTAPQIYFDAFN